ncbi:MAG TPA: TauD/TfdA family dioxygenase, partial [Pilimelia sp.]|nr:TauD/TfdA family dioxygenase [Pilimelia sp.]
MSVLAQRTTRAAVVAPDEESSAIAQVARRLCTVAGGRVDSAEFVAAARDAWEDLPAGLRRSLRRFRRDSGHHGVLLLRNLPVGADTLGDTPMVAGSVQREATVAAALLLSVAAGLGDPAAFQPEKSGALVQDVVPVPGQEHVQGNVGSTQLSFHSENAFHQHRPDYVMLLCLRADRDGVAGTL